MTEDQLEAWFLDDESPTFEMIRDAEDEYRAFTIAIERLDAMNHPISDLALIRKVVLRIRCHI